MKRHYHPKPGKIVSRYRFYTHHRQDGQSASEFVSELHRLAEYCEFTDKLEEMSCDFFIIGINDDSILRKLHTESDPNLAKVMEIATVCMQTAESLRVISNKSKVIQQDPSVNKVTFGYKQKCFSKPPNSPPPPDISESTRKVGVSCWRCRGYHQAFQCRYRNYTCDNCGKR